MTEIDYNAWRFWIGIGQMLFNIGVFAWLWNNRKHQATNDRVQKVEARTETTEKDLLQVKEQLKHLPSQNDIGRIHSRIDDVNGALREVVGGLKALNSSVALINEHLLNRGKP